MEKPRIKILADRIVNGIAHRACPHCGEMKPIDDFGLRRMRPLQPGEPPMITNQSWCRPCRNPSR